MARRAPPPAALHGTPDEVEAQFYEGLQQGKLDQVMAAWADDDEIACVHPGGARLVGTAAVRAGFEAILAQGNLALEPLRVRRLHTLGCAVHHVAERISANTPDGPQSAWVWATNVYIKTPQGWRMVAHHASAAGMVEPGDDGGEAVLH